MILIQAVLLLYFYNEQTKIKIFEAFVIQGSILLSSKPNLGGTIIQIWSPFRWEL